jgi:ATP-binding cassette subfamily B protein
MSVGGFVAVNAYIMQVMMPLNFLGFVYREIRQALVDMSEMFSLKWLRWTDKSSKVRMADLQ